MSNFYDQLADKLTWLMEYGDDLYLAVGSDIRDVIYNTPTACDVDKVVENVRCRCYEIGLDESQTEIIVSEIVKAGLKNEN